MIWKAGNLVAVQIIKGLFNNNCSNPFDWSDLPSRWRDALT